MRFLVDEMLGSLAKWLRILGYDTAYFQRMEDNDLIRLARAEGRLLLTRDTQLTRRKGVDCLLIESDEVEGQLREVFRRLRLPANSPFSRCPLCNTPLQEVEKASIKGRVPPYVFKTQEHFSICPRCDKIYWQGTHWQRMRRRISRLGFDKKPNCNIITAVLF